MKRASSLLLAALVAGCGGAQFESAPLDDAGPQDASVADSSPDGAKPDASKPDAADSGKAEAGKDAQVTEASVVEAAVPDAAVICQNQQDREFTAMADGIITSDNCNGANSYTNGPHANVGAGRGLVRFQLGPELVVAFATPDKVLGMSLVLTRNATCEGDINACVGTAKAGQILAYPLVWDWVESKGGDQAGADWCRKGAGGQGAAQWQVPGAEGPNDRGLLAGLEKVDILQPTVTIPLDAAAFKGWVTDNGQLNVLLIAEPGAMFVFATHESTLFEHPKLRIKYCQ